LLHMIASRSRVQPMAAVDPTVGAADAATRDDFHRAFQNLAFQQAFTAADHDRSGKLNRDEFASFLAIAMPDARLRPAHGQPGTLGVGPTATSNIGSVPPSPSWCSGRTAHNVPPSPRSPGAVDLLGLPQGGRRLRKDEHLNEMFKELQYQREQVAARIGVLELREQKLKQIDAKYHAG